MSPTVKAALLRAARTFLQAFVGVLVANSADIGVALSPLHAVELAGIAGLVALAHNLPPERPAPTLTLPVAPVVTYTPVAPLATYATAPAGRVLTFPKQNPGQSKPDDPPPDSPPPPPAA